MKKQRPQKVPIIAILFSLLCLGLPMHKTLANPGENIHYQQGQPLRKVLDQIGTHYGVIFLFESKQIDNKTTAYQFNAAGTTIEKALSELLTPLGLKASKVDNSNYAIVGLVTEKAEPAKQPANNKQEPAPVVINTDNKPVENVVLVSPTVINIIKGRVVTETKEDPIPGASIVVKGINTGTCAYLNQLLHLRVAENHAAQNVGIAKKALHERTVHHLPKRIRVLH